MLASKPQFYVLLFQFFSYMVFWRLHIKLLARSIWDKYFTAIDFTFWVSHEFCVFWFHFVAIKFEIWYVPYFADVGSAGFWIVLFTMHRKSFLSVIYELSRRMITQCVYSTKHFRAILPLSYLWTLIGCYETYMTMMLRNLERSWKTVMVEKGLRIKKNYEK